MKGSNSNHSNSTETIKVIVEAPLPKKGQKLSSGGVRENGKIASQYKHPQRYIETPKKSVVKPASSVYKEKVKAYVANEALDVIGTTAHMAFDDVGKRVLHKWFQMAADRIIDAMTDDKPAKKTKSERPDEEVTKSSESQENIVHFPDERVG